MLKEAIYQGVDFYCLLGVEKYVRDHGVASTIYVTAVNGIVKKYIVKSASRSDPGIIGCKNRHLGSLRDFERFWVHKRGYIEC
jgi:hypothetical protein